MLQRCEIVLCICKRTFLSIRCWGFCILALCICYIPVEVLKLLVLVAMVAVCAPVFFARALTLISEFSSFGALALQRMFGL